MNTFMKGIDLSQAGLSSANAFRDQTIDPRQFKEKKENPILAHSLDDLIYKEDIRIFVNKHTGECFRETLNKSSDGSIEKIPSTPVRRHNNGTNIMVSNMGKNYKYQVLTQHRATYATINNLPYDGDYVISHLDNNSLNNSIDNLFIIRGSKHKPNVEEKRLAYQLLALYKQHGDNMFNSSLSIKIIN